MQKNTRVVEVGYLYVLTHPSSSSLFKVGKTTRHPEARLNEHNSRQEEYTGKIVKETGQSWSIHTFISVPDTYWAEAVFWAAVGLADIPYRRRIEIASLDLKAVEVGLEAVKKAGMRPRPDPLADHVYAYRAWMNKRIRGRDISLVGHVRSKFGRSTFRCDNGHEWRAVPDKVAEGEGCPHCGIGTKGSEEIRKGLSVGGLWLLVHPEKPGLVKIGLTDNASEKTSNEDFWGGWQVHRYRNVEEPELAESLIWELLGQTPHSGGRAINIELSIAEEAFASIHYRLVSEIALIERAKDMV